VRGCTRSVTFTTLPKWGLKPLQRAANGEKLEKRQVDHALSMSLFSHFCLKKRMDSACFNLEFKPKTVIPPWENGLNAHE
jgi:hypothetical protein